MATIQPVSPQPPRHEEHGATFKTELSATSHLAESNPGPSTAAPTQTIEPAASVLSPMGVGTKIDSGA